MTKKKNELKIIKGTKIKLWCDDSGFTVADEILLADDTTVETLDMKAMKFMLDNLQPKWGWEIVE